MINYYTYRLDNPITKEFYFGSRSCSCKIEEDIYMGSMKTWKPNKEDLVKTILKSNFRKRETCIKHEVKLIKENIDNPLNRNYHIPGIGFHTNGRIMPEEQKERQRVKMINKPSGENHHMHGKKIPQITGNKNPAKRSVVRKKISEALMGNKHPNFGKPAHTRKIVEQYTKDGIFIKEWEFIKKAGDALKINPYNISSCCRGKLKTVGGYKWEYKI